MSAACGAEPPASTSASPGPLARFNEFHAALMSIRDALRARDWAELLDGPAGPGMAPDTLERRLPSAIRARLTPLIKPTMPAVGAPDTIDTGFVLAVVADEVLLRDVNWPGRDAWAKLPLRTVLYADAALPSPSAHAGASGGRDDVAMTMMLALDLGYLAHREGADENAQAGGRKQLLARFTFRTNKPAVDAPPDLMTGSVPPLVGQAERLPALRPWYIACAIVAGGALVAGLLVWSMQVSGTIFDTTRVLASLSASR